MYGISNYDSYSLGVACSEDVVANIGSFATAYINITVPGTNLQVWPLCTVSRATNGCITKRNSVTVVLWQRIVIQWCMFLVWIEKHPLSPFHEILITTPRQPQGQAGKFVPLSIFYDSFQFLTCVKFFSLITPICL